ncbi:DUF3025 domain-containing protein [Agaribacter flavus]|uniref:DUF3025 domain-containing protein n=1 Tax=Agaribacter flavus TaxID=1902781 RepID=A0ABV7FK90_9ALTE
MISRAKPENIERYHQAQTVAEFCDLVQSGKLSSAFSVIFQQLIPRDLPIDVLLSAECIENLKTTLCNNSGLDKIFLSQDCVDKSAKLSCKYYEEIIFEDGFIPTRKSNWHDFFNGLIWLQMPKTKNLLNRMHMDEIKRIGCKPRGAIRDRITHFDECGLVLFVKDANVAAMLNEHNWKALFVENRDKWFTDITPFVFGHALWEMLLEPFIGLTAKALVIDVSTFEQPLSTSQMDDLLCAYLRENAFFQQKKRLKPLPLLGIPGWHVDVQDKDFYDNENYFMPKK